MESKCRSRPGSTRPENQIKWFSPSLSAIKPYRRHKLVACRLDAARRAMYSVVRHSSGNTRHEIDVDKVANSCSVDRQHRQAPASKRVANTSGRHGRRPSRKSQRCAAAKSREQVFRKTQPSEGTHWGRCRRGWKKGANDQARYAARLGKRIGSTRAESGGHVYTAPRRLLLSPALVVNMVRSGMASTPLALPTAALACASLLVYLLLPGLPAWLDLELRPDEQCFETNIEITYCSWYSL